MQKFLTLVLIAAVLLATVLLLREGDSETHLNRFEEIKKSGVLRCGYIEFPPYLWRNDKTGILEGVMVDLMKEMEITSGLKIDWVPASNWGDIPADLNLGKYDIYCANVWLNTARAKEALGTDPIFYNRLLLFKHPGTDKTPETGMHQAIDGTMESNIMQRNVDQERQISLPGTTSYPEALRGLAQGKADYALFEENVAWEHNKNNPRLRIEKPADAESHFMPIVLMVGKNEHSLAAFLNAALMELDYMGVIKQLARKYNRPEHTIFYLQAE